VRLAQPFAMRARWWMGRGILGRWMAIRPADRYTEARLTRVSTALLEDLDKEAVDFYRTTTARRHSGGAAGPYELAGDGSDGIAVHGDENSAAQFDGDCRCHDHAVNNPGAQLPEILKFVQGPDFPTAGIFTGAPEFLRRTDGGGRFMMRARAAIENVTKDKQAIIVTEIVSGE